MEATTKKSKKPAIKTINKHEILEAVKQLPIEGIIKGEGKKGRLTHKQKTFAHKIAEGKTKAQAYRESYNTSASPQIVGNEASRLSTHPLIDQEIKAHSLALEAMKYRNAEQTKALVIHQLTQHAINEDNPPQVRLNALKMLGQSYDVGLFVERKQVETINHSSDIKSKLMGQLQSILRNNAIDVDDNSADSLLAELRGGSSEIVDMEVAPPPPRNDPSDVGSYTHSIPHTQTPSESYDSDNQSQNSEENQ